MVRLQNLKKKYASQRESAVDDLSLDIHEGEIFTLLGPSGCGKTTTLRMVAGLESPDAGSIYFRDKPIVVMSQRLFVPPEKREIGMVFQSYAVWPHMTLEENVAYPLTLRKVPSREIRDRVHRVLGLVGLQHLASRPAPLLSGGQQQRMALARALVYEPGLLLLDEPFCNLDSQLREQMRIEVKMLQARLKVTVLFVTHDQVEALSLSNRIAVMKQGRVQQLGTPRDLYENPANTFVRDFLGKTVNLRGVASVYDPSGFVDVAIQGGGGWPVRIATNRTFVPGDAVCVSFRPEDASLTNAAAEQADASLCLLPGKVEATLFVGERTEYRIEIDGQDPILVYGDRRHLFDERQNVSIALPTNRLSVWPWSDTPLEV